MLILLSALFSSSGLSEVYVQGHDYSESDIKLSPQDLYVIPPYNITFDFSGMDKFKVDEYISGPSRMEKYESVSEPQEYGWKDERVRIQLSTLDHKSRINIDIYRYFTTFNPYNRTGMVTECQKCERINANDAFVGISPWTNAVISNTPCIITKINNITWTYYTQKIVLPNNDRPIPTNGSYGCGIEGLPETSQSLPNEVIQISVVNLPKDTVDQFINSLNITGLGKGGIERTENWEDYDARVRRPSDYNGYKPSISALEFIAALYPIGIRYDPKTGSLNSTSIYTRTDIQYITKWAIKDHYWGPIPLPKNVSLALPNGE